ncbi:MAG: alpha/beta fold hydrolase [Aliidongia sp.]
MRSIVGLAAALWCAALSVLAGSADAQDIKIDKTDRQIDGRDPGVKLFLREKMAAGNSKFTDDNIVLFLHGATSPSACDFDLGYKDYSWADWLVKQGYVVYMGDYRNYGGSSREAAMDAPAAQHEPLTRSYLALRDVEAMVDAIKAEHHVGKVTLIGWSWGAMMAGYYASLHSENLHKLVLYAPLYNFNDHTNLGPGSGLQDKRKPYQFNAALGAYRFASEAANTGRWNGEIPTENKTSIATRPSRSNSGKPAWRPIRPAKRAAPPACARPMACWKIPSIRRLAAHSGTPPISMRRPWLSAAISIAGRIRRIAKG